MTSPARIAANKRNAQLSTGPKTDAGKAIARMNALAHGLRTNAPIVPGEDPAHWEQYRAAVIADQAPVGVLETELAERVAVLSWRLRRVTAFEAGIVAAACEKAMHKLHFPNSIDRLLENDFDGKLAEMMAKTSRGIGVVQRELDGAEKEGATFTRRAELLGRWADVPDAEPVAGEDAADLLEAVAYQGPMRDDAVFELDDWELLEAAGVPEEWREEPTEWDGWTAGHVRAGMAHLVAVHADDVGDPLPVRLRRVVREAEKGRVQWAEQAERLRAELVGLEATIAEREAEARNRVLIPTAEQSDRVLKYENHIQRQLMQTLHQLERMRAMRSDHPPQPPVAVDIVVHGAERLPALAIPQ
jgi:hypothetical protein